MLQTTERVDRLENMMAEVAHAQMRTEMSLLALSKEMTEFKNEMTEFKNEMTGFKDEMTGFKAEMAEFKDWVKDGIEESRQDRKRMNKAWGDLANKMGTTVEDVVAPNIPRFARDEFGMGERTDLLIRARRISRRGEQREREYDVICAGSNKVIIVEVKSTPAKVHIPEFLDSLQDFADFYPEYADFERIYIFASWSLPNPIRKVAAEAGLYGIAMGDETMEIVARP